MIKKCLWGVILITSVVSCTEDEIEDPRSYPDVNSLPVSAIGDGGATFNAEINKLGNTRILRYGFVWGRCPVEGSQIPDPPSEVIKSYCDNLDLSLESSDKVIFNGSPAQTTFSAKISTSLIEGEHYIVRPFIEVEDLLIYGSSFQFLSAG